MTHSSTGPIPAEEFKALVDMPHGRALKAIRKYDPLYGKLSNDGEPIKWKVTLIQEVRMVGYVTVEAVNAEEAELVAGDISDRDVTWHFDSADASYVEGAEPL
jgi:hypothetical protein